jgi:ABC-type polysaccharide/polyol phosphate transport system ATPase subunit
VASITLERAWVEIPIYNARGRSLRSNLLRRVGGQLASDERDIVTVKALSDVSLSLRPGDRLGIVGHNGAGKSTLLRVLSGAYEPSRGTAEIVGTVSSLLDITMGMDPELTGIENIILRGALIGLSMDEARALTPDIADFSELGDYLNVPLRTYSTGMILRLAFAVSTARHRDILLLDELIGVGDATFAAKARRRVEQMMSGARILALASHAPDVIRQYCNRAILLRAGTVVADGDVGEVLAEYKGTVPG